MAHRTPAGGAGAVLEGVGRQVGILCHLALGADAVPVVKLAQVPAVEEGLPGVRGVYVAGV